MSEITYTSTIKKPCAFCKKLFRARLSEIEIGKGKYCSTGCRAEGLSAHAEIIASLPCTGAGIAYHVGTSKYSVMHTINRLCKAGRMHAAGLCRTFPHPGKRGVIYTVYFEAGPAPSDDFPPDAKPALSFFLKKMVLDVMPATGPQIMAATDLSRSTVAKLVNELRAEKRVYVKGWKRPKSKGVFMAVYAPGAAADVPCQLERRTKKDAYARYIKRLDRSGKLEAFREKSKEKRGHLKMRKVTGDPLLNALFGSPVERRKKERNVLADKAVSA